jgi:HK97 family phage prohead protease
VTWAPFTTDGAPNHPQTHWKGANVDQKDFKFKIKSLKDDGSFEGLGAVYNNVDQGNDRILPGAFTRTLSAGKKFPVLWQHKSDCPIGSCTITDSPAGLQVMGTLELSDPTAQKAYTFMKSGVIRGLSIGYETLQSSYDGDVRNLTELKLYEISAVTFPMNEAAQISAVKSLSDDDRAKHFKAISEHIKAIGRHQRGVRDHLKAMSDAFDDDPEDEALLLDEGDDEEMAKSFLAEMQKLVVQAKELA